MIEKIFTENEVSIKDFNTFYYKLFIENIAVLFVSSNLSKKGFSEFKRKTILDSFYPFYLIKINDEDSETIKENKLNEEKKRNPPKELFLQRYYQIIRKQFNINNETNIFPTLLKEIKNCPYCKKNEFILSHSYTLESCNHIEIFFKCTSCNETLISDTLKHAILDVFYTYNENIKLYMDKYIEFYPNGEDILLEINKEFKKTETMNIRKSNPLSNKKLQEYFE